MSKQIKHFLPVLTFLNTLSEKDQRTHLLNAPVNLIKFITDTCLNLNFGYFDIEKENILNLKPYKKWILILCKRSLSIEKRREIIAKKGFFARVIGDLIPYLLRIVNE